MKFYERYQNGSCQEVYDELLTLGHTVFNSSVYDDTLAVAQEMMRRVRSNIEILLPRLHSIGYQFGKGFFEQFADMTSEEVALIQQDVPIFNPPTVKTQKQVSDAEQLVGSLPLSLKCWYTEVGSVNLVGAFPHFDATDFRRGSGYGLDPLFLYSVEMAIKMVTQEINIGIWQRYPILSLSPSADSKSGSTGSESYGIKLPCRAFDAPLLNEWHRTTLVNYLRICFRWGGFPGLEGDDRFPQEIMEFLTKDLLPF